MPLFAVYTHKQNEMLKLSQAFNKMYSEIQLVCIYSGWMLKIVWGTL